MVHLSLHVSSGHRNGHVVLADDATLWDALWEAAMADRVGELARELLGAEQVLCGNFSRHPLTSLLFACSTWPSKSGLHSKHSVHGQQT